MTLSKFQKIVVGAVSIWPIIYLFIFFSFIFSQVFSAASRAQQQVPSFDTFKIIFALHFLTMVVIVALISFYIYFIFNSERVPKDKKTLWAVVIFLGSMISIPVFWFLYIWPVSGEADASKDLPQDE